MVLAVMLCLTVMGLACVAVALTRHVRVWDSAASLVFLVAVAGNLPHPIALITGRYVDRVDPSTGWPTRVLLSPNAAVPRAALVATFFVALFLLLRGIRGRQKVNYAGLAALALATTLALANVGQPQSIPVNAWLFTTVVFAASCVLPSGEGAWMGAATFGVAFAAFNSSVALIRPDLGTTACSPTKCGPLQVLVPGGTESENALAMALVLSLPFIILMFKGWHRTLSVITVAALVYVSGSRTSLAGLAVVLLLSAVISSRSQSKRVKRVFSISAVIVAAAVSFAVPRLTVYDPSSFSRRGFVWATALRSVSESPILGYGSAGWGYLVEHFPNIGSGAIYSAHNQWLDVQFAAGYVGLALFAVWLLCVLLPADDPMVALLVLGPALIVSITERPWPFGSIEWVLWVTVATTLAIPKNEPPPQSKFLDAQQMERSVLRIGE